MAEIIQFNKGEMIEVTVPSVYDDGSPNPNGTLYAYIDNLDLSSDDNLVEADGSSEISNANYAEFDASEDDDFGYILKGSKTKQLQPGSYTVEFSYGEDGDSLSIIKKNSAFTLVSSITSILDTSQSS